MIAVRPTEHIASSLSLIVQAWIVAERTNRRLLVQWDSLPVGQITIHPFFDYARRDPRQDAAILEYHPSMHRPEDNKHLITYYHQRIFGQILLIRQPLALPYAHKQICLWGDSAVGQLSEICRKHWCKLKHLYLFREGERLETPITYAQGVIPPKILQEVSAPVENWNSLLYLHACNVLVAATSPFIEVIRMSFRNKENWEVVEGVGLVRSK